ncbi:allatostatin A [Rhodnius prolixus]|uniref:Allatostatin A n=1 Tax=Rhodnius prolixus TaxID=13249 RepID=D0EM53_RHOPR|nr:allatostatin A precursor [Rhodnius prolixus]AET51834.1 FGLamide-related allatostatin precursor [Rhodnius prolixus]
MMLPFIVLLVVDVFALGAQAINDREDDFNKKLTELGLGKRAAYSYVSEYKRLPVYNFGLGKRAHNEGRLYSFGLGKRDYDSGEEMEYLDDELAIRDELAKRAAKMYSFGLGKRLPSIKYPEGKMYSFGLGKRVPFADQAYFLDDNDSSEESKRSNPNGHRFSFGLGKRDEQEMNEKRKGERSMQYSFGLGKRTQLDPANNLHN